MSAEHRGSWQQVSRCTECGWVTGKEIKWMVTFFEPVCPNCGEYNNTGGFLPTSDLFESVTAREVRRGFFRRFVRWEFKAEATAEQPIDTGKTNDD